MRTWFLLFCSMLLSAQQFDVNTRTLTLFPSGTGSGETGNLRFRELRATGSQYVAFKAPDAISSNVVWTLPATDSSGTKCLASDGAGTLSWATCSAGTGTPGGADTNVQYNDGGNFGGDGNFAWDKTNAVLRVGGSTGERWVIQKSGDLLGYNALSDVNPAISLIRDSADESSNLDSGVVILKNGSTSTVTLAANAGTGAVGGLTFRSTSFSGSTTIKAAAVTTGPDLEFTFGTGGAGIPDSDGAYNWGLAARRWGNMYTVNLNISGTCTGCGTGTAPGGANTNIQYNDSSAFGGDANLTWDKTNKSMSVGGANLSSASVVAYRNSAQTVVMSERSTAQDVLHEWYDGTVSTYVGLDTTNGNLFLGSDTVNKDDLVVKASNNRVGIGTVSPASTFHVAGNTTLGGSLVVEPSSADTSPFFFVDPTASNIVSFTMGNDNGATVWQAGTSSATSGAFLNVFTNAGSRGVRLDGDNSRVVIGEPSTTTGTLRFYHISHPYFLTLQPGSSQTADKTFTLPSADGTNGDCLITNGSGGLSFNSICGVGAPAGSSGDLQYKSGTGFGATARMNWSPNRLNLGGQLDVKVSDTITAPFFFVDPTSVTDIISVTMANSNGATVWQSGTSSASGGAYLNVFTNAGSRGVKLDGDNSRIIVGEPSTTTGSLRLYNLSHGNFVTLQSNSSMAANKTFTLPGADGSSGDCLTTNGSGTLSFSATCGSASSPPFVDSTSIVKGSVDGTKQLRFEVDGFGTGVTRVLTVQASSDYTIAGIGLNNSWSADQLPATNNTYKMGNSSFGWSEVWTHKLNAQDTFTSRSIVPNSNNTYTIGTNESNRYSSGYFTDVYLGQSSAATGTLHISNATSGTATLTAEQVSSVLGITSNVALYPGADNTLNLGTSGRRWATLNAQRVSLWNSGINTAFLDANASLGGVVSLADTGGTEVARMDANTGGQPFVLLNGSFVMKMQATSASSASAGIRTLPSNPEGFLIFTFDGVNKKIPFYGN